jgi:membrane carboxypeptidase/penicillin-binding protein PbpC
LLDLAAAYGTLANGGTLHRAFAVTRVRDANGRVLYERAQSPGRAVVSSEVAFLLADILADDDARSAGFGRHSILELPFPAAVKTGTTTEFHDNWTVGFTPRQVVGVWVGNVDNRPMLRVSGIDGAAPIWAEVMKAAREIQGAQTFNVPPGLVREEVCTPTGLLPGNACPTVQFEWFVAGTQPTAIEAYYVRETGRLAIDPPPAARPWLAMGGFPLAETQSPDDGLSIAAPADGAVFYLAPELPRQELAVRLACPAATRAVQILLDGRPAASRDGCAGSITIPLTPGTHSLVVRADIGIGGAVEAATTYEVRQP